MGGVTANELKRWLKRQGCTFSEGTNHTMVHRGSLFTPMPRHPSAEIATGTYNKILKDLGIKKS